MASPKIDEIRTNENQVSIRASHMYIMFFDSNKHDDDDDTDMDTNIDMGFDIYHRLLEIG